MRYTFVFGVGVKDCLAEIPRLEDREDELKRRIVNQAGVIGKIQNERGEIRADRNKFRGQLKDMTAWRDTLASSNERLTDELNEMRAENDELRKVRARLIGVAAEKAEIQADHSNCLSWAEVNRRRTWELAIREELNGTIDRLRTRVQQLLDLQHDPWTAGYKAGQETLQLAADLVQREAHEVAVDTMVNKAITETNTLNQTTISNLRMRIASLQEQRDQLDRLYDGEVLRANAASDRAGRTYKQLQELRASTTENVEVIDRLNRWHDALEREIANAPFTNDWTSGHLSDIRRCIKAVRDGKEPEFS